MTRRALVLFVSLLCAHALAQVDGAWCWFADPRAISVNGRTWMGWVSSEGDIVVGGFARDGRAVQQSVLHEKFEVDDHANPALLLLPTGRIMAFYTHHTGRAMYTRTTSRPYDIRDWTEERLLDLNRGASGGLTSYTYPNPAYLADAQRILITWRGLDWKPTLAWSDDFGETWSEPHILFARKGAGSGNRPYTKVVSDGKGRMHFLVTDGHPRNEPTNSVYHFYYESESFYRADGTRIGGLADLPLTPEQVDVVYDARETNARAWVWDIALDDDRPVAVFARLPQENSHEYWRAHWDGLRWVRRKIADAGGWFPETPEGKREPEPHYSGGIVLDHSNPDVAYASRQIDGVFEIERYETTDGGDSWSRFPVTTSSSANNVRPVAIRGAVEGAPTVAWMHNSGGYEHYLRYRTEIQLADATPSPLSGALDKASVLNAAFRVADWQLATPSRHAPLDWTNAAMYAGMMAAARLPGGERFEEAMLAKGAELGWKLGPRPYMADDHAVAQTWTELYIKHRRQEMIAPWKERADDMLTKPFDEPLLWVNGVHDREWAWCDSLFMAPPALMLLAKATGDTQYLDLMNRLWWKTTDYLYDPEERLYYRDSRYFEPREANGEKVFWSRGNGWVIAGLARVLQHMPADYHSRGRFEELFRQMAFRLKEVQREDGYWTSSLLDPESYPAPETSGTGFYCFALAYGINSGLLARDEYLPTVQNAWAALVAATNEGGKLGWVQPVGQDPRTVQADSTDVFGVGAFLLAASEVYALSD